MSWTTQADVDNAKLSAANLPAAVRFDVPNMDGLHDGELSGLEWVWGQLALYADIKRRAMAHRIGGDIEAALSSERALERVYKALPEWARW